MAIEFKIGKGWILTARAGKWRFQIHESGSFYWVVAVRAGGKKNEKRLETCKYQQFGSTAEAAEFCAELADGRLDPDQLLLEYMQYDAVIERAEIREAVRRAKAFRDKLEAAGLSYSKLLDLERDREAMGEMANNFLAGWERGEEWPNV